jgi:hypothetical protein
VRPWTGVDVVSREIPDNESAGNRTPVVQPKPVALLAEL